MNDEARDWLYAAIAQSGFVVRYPGYLSILSQLDPVADPSLPVMGVSLAGSRFRLHLNLGYCTAHPEYLHGVLLHEIHHLVLGHLTHPNFRGSVFPDLMALAMETSANEYIQEPLPDTPCRWEDFAAFGLDAGQSTLERYERLAEARRTGRLPDLAPRRLEAHRLWAQGESSPPTSDEMPAQLERILAELAQAPVGEGQRPPRLAGRTPGQLLQALRPLDSPPLDWRRLVEDFVQRLRAPLWSFTYPNRRCPDRLGEVPGRRRRVGTRERPTLLVAIDTSGSMDEDSLAGIASQVRRLAVYAQVTILECDAAIQRAYPFRGHLVDLQGRGGTDLRPVFAPECLARYRPDGILYFTDGLGPYPHQPPPIPTLWVLAGAAPFDCPWGRQVRIEKMG